MISVIIPTLNSAEELKSSLSALIPATLQGVVKQVVIVDGGSTDATEDIAHACGAIFISSEKGRGHQLCAGAEAIATTQKSEDWLLFLHADTVLQPDWDKRAAQFMAKAHDAHAGYFTFKFNETSLQAASVQLGVRLRCWLFNLPYGDQGLLISRQFYDDLGGYRRIPLFEDVDIVRRLKKSGTLRRLKSAAITSASRYQQIGYFARVIRNFRCLWLYYRGVPPEKILEIYQ